MMRPIMSNRNRPAGFSSEQFRKLKHHIILSERELASFRTKLCEGHQAGFCMDSDSCPNSHCLTWQRRSPFEVPYSSKLCPDIQFVKKGSKMSLVRRCNRGRQCLFAHSKEEELYHPLMYKTKMCSAHPACNRCHCPFAHDSEEIRRPYDNPLLKFLWISPGDGPPMPIVDEHKVVAARSSCGLDEVKQFLASSQSSTEVVSSDSSTRSGSNSSDSLSSVTLQGSNVLPSTKLSEQSESSCESRELWILNRIGKVSASIVPPPPPLVKVHNIKKVDHTSEWNDANPALFPDPGATPAVYDSPASTPAPPPSLASFPGKNTSVSAASWNAAARSRSKSGSDASLYPHNAPSQPHSVAAVSGFPHCKQKFVGNDKVEDHHYALKLHHAALESMHKLRGENETGSDDNRSQLLLVLQLSGMLASYMQKKSKSGYLNNVEPSCSANGSQQAGHGRQIAGHDSAGRHESSESVVQMLPTVEVSCQEDAPQPQIASNDSFSGVIPDNVQLCPFSRISLAAKVLGQQQHGVNAHAAASNATTRAPTPIHHALSISEQDFSPTHSRACQSAAGSGTIASTDISLTIGPAKPSEEFRSQSNVCGETMRRRRSATLPSPPHANKSTSGPLTESRLVSPSIACLTACDTTSHCTAKIAPTNDNAVANYLALGSMAKLLTSSPSASTRCSASHGPVTRLSSPSGRALASPSDSVASSSCDESFHRELSQDDLSTSAPPVSELGYENCAVPPTCDARRSFTNVESYSSSAAMKARQVVFPRRSGAATGRSAGNFDEQHLEERIANGAVVHSTWKVLRDTTSAICTGHVKRMFPPNSRSPFGNRERARTVSKCINDSDDYDRLWDEIHFQRSECYGVTGAENL